MVNQEILTPEEWQMVRGRDLEGFKHDCRSCPNSWEGLKIFMAALYLCTWRGWSIRDGPGVNSCCSQLQLLVGTMTHKNDFMMASADIFGPFWRVTHASAAGHQGRLICLAPQVEAESAIKACDLTYLLQIDWPEMHETVRHRLRCLIHLKLSVHHRYLDLVHDCGLLCAVKGSQKSWSPSMTSLRSPQRLVPHYPQALLQRIKRLVFWYNSDQYSSNEQLTCIELSPQILNNQTESGIIRHCTYDSVACILDHDSKIDLAKSSLCVTLDANPIIGFSAWLSLPFFARSHWAPTMQ